MLIALVGNQNSGKTTLFNQLTGSNQHVGNFPGITVEKKEGSIKKHKELIVVDLPGIYSLSPYTSEEVVTRNFIIQEKPDVILNIVDATNIERNLYLSLQLMQLQTPMVIALNMMDEVKSSGNSIDLINLENELGVPVAPISASKNEGIADLITRIKKTGEEKILPKKIDCCVGEVHKAIHSLTHLIEDHALAAGIPPRFAATKLVEGDELIVASLKLNENEIDIVGHIVKEMETELGTDREAALADSRYSYIEAICEKTVFSENQTKEQIRSVKIDALLTHKYLALPIFLLIMLVIFSLTFGTVGHFLSSLFTQGINFATSFVDNALSQTNVSTWMHSLIVNGIFAGIGSVLSFMPLILLLFFFLSLLEDTGYMARVAFVMDRLLRKIGLSGRSFVPMLIGFGCSVPAIMATRTLSSERDRKMTIILTPFMSCSARLPVYALFCAALFPKYAALVMITLYLMGIAVAILSGLLLKNTAFKGKPIPFVMELPAYRMPSPKSVLFHMWDKGKDFVKRAFTIIFIATIVIWFLRNLDWTFNMTSDPQNSILASIGSFIAPIFKPLGFGDWRAATAIITGLTAKEAIISTFTVLMNTSDTQALISALGTLFTPLSAFAFLTFILLYTPCAAAIAATKREIGSLRGTLFAIGYQTGTAYIVALIVFQVGRLFI